jgi:hypothetical protein
MDARTRRTHTSRWLAVSLLVAAAAAYAGKPALSTGEAAAPAPQELMRLESRLGQLEQRFISVEAGIRSLEQQVRFPSAAPGANARDPEVGLLRAEVETLRRRLADVECGLTRVDERTLTPAAREARRKSPNAAAAPCRLDADAPARP